MANYEFQIAKEAGPSRRAFGIKERRGWGARYDSGRVRMNLRDNENMLTQA